VNKAPGIYNDQKGSLWLKLDYPIKFFVVVKLTIWHNKLYSLSLGSILSLVASRGPLKY
jgi:hypothetical protein